MLRLVIAKFFMVIVILFIVIAWRFIVIAAVLVSLVWQPVAQFWRKETADIWFPQFLVVAIINIYVLSGPVSALLIKMRLMKDPTAILHPEAE